MTPPKPALSRVSGLNSSADMHASQVSLLARSMAAPTTTYPALEKA